MSTTPRTDAARGFHDMKTAVSAEDMAKIETELARLRADLERFTGQGLLDCHAICDQRDSAVSERDQLRAEVERLNKAIKVDTPKMVKLNDEILTENGRLLARAELAEASAKLWEADALRYANNTEFWKARAEKAEADLAAMTTCAKKLNEECELWEIRCGSIICSGVLDSYTGADLQKWEDEFKKKRGDLIARAEKAEAESLEQARLLGISGSREAALLSEIEFLKKIIAESQQQINAKVNT